MAEHSDWTMRSVYEKEDEKKNEKEDEKKNEKEEDEEKNEKEEDEKKDEKKDDGKVKFYENLINLMKKAGMKEEHSVT